MTIQIRCPRCRQFFGAPDLESVRTYAAQGGIIQTLTERIITEVVHKHYVTPGPLWKAEALTLPFIFLAPSAPYIIGMSPLVAGILAVTLRSIALVWASTDIEEREIEEDPPDDDGTEMEQSEQMPAPFEQVTKPGPNSMSIRRVHEPPRDDDPKRQISLARADVALAKLATSSAYPMEPISWAEAQRRRYPHGEKTFYQIQKHWLDRGLAFKSSTGAVYLKPSGIKILRQYSSQ